MAEMKKQTEFKLYKRDSVFFDQNTAPVNIAYAHEVNDVAILPLGAIEQHGPHCPNGLDSFNAICLAKKVAEKSGATVLPCPMYGGHPYMHMGMPGTITLNYETNMALLHDIIASASNVGYNKFIMLVAHGADSSFIPAVHKLGMEGYFVLASTWYDFLRDNKNVLEDFMWHADEAETSMALSLYGDLVHMDLAIDGGGTPLVDAKWKMAPGEASHRWQFYGAEGTFALLEKDDLDYGVIGNPTKATKEKGDKLVEAVVEGYSELIKELLETHPVGKNPLGFRNPLGYNGFLRQGPRREGPTHLLQEVTPVFRAGRKTFRFSACSGFPKMPDFRCAQQTPRSSLSAMYDDRGVFDAYLFLDASPDIVMVDPCMICPPPARF